MVALQKFMSKGALTNNQDKNNYQKTISKTNYTNEHGFQQYLEKQSTIRNSLCADINSLGSLLSCVFVEQIRHI